MNIIVAEPVVPPLTGSARAAVGDVELSAMTSHPALDAGDVELSVAGSRASAPPARGADSRGWLGMLAWWVLGRWLAVPLVAAAGLADSVLVVLRLLKRDVLDLPRWHVARRDPLGLVLQLAVQLPLGTPVALLMPLVFGLEYILSLIHI